MMYVAIFAGGALGSLVRELVVPMLPSIWPLTTAFVPNVVACFVIGVLYGIRHRIHVHLMHLAAVGFCGGLSTFSTFAAEVFDLITAGDVAGSLLAPTLEIVVGILAASVGEVLVRRDREPPSR